MNQEEYAKNHLTEVIQKGRLDGWSEQEIYNTLASEGYDREYVIQKMTYMVHPDDSKKARWYNRILICMMCFGIFFQFMNGSSFAILNILAYIVFIYLFGKNSISAYYWYLFFAILSSTTILPAFLETKSIIILVIGISIVTFPIIICLKTLKLLLPHKDGKNIGMTSDGVHIFLK